MPMLSIVLSHARCVCLVLLQSIMLDLLVSLMCSSYGSEDPGNVNMPENRFVACAACTGLVLRYRMSVWYTRVAGMS